MNIDIGTIHESRGASLVEDLNKIFERSKLFNITLRQISLKKDILGSSKSLEEIERKISHPKLEGSFQLLELPGLSRFTPKSIILGQKRTAYFSTDADAVKIYNFLRTRILKEESLTNTILHMIDPINTGIDSYLRRRIPPADEYDIMFTVLNPEPESLNINFDVAVALDEYISPFLKELEDMNMFHIKSQWLYFVNLQVNPKEINSSTHGHHFALAEELLSGSITPLEKKLATHVSKHPCLNFILYIPPCHQSPLHIYNTKGQRVQGYDAYISPRWGGIQIYNPTRKECETSEERASVVPDKHYIMPIFLQQIRLLLGLQDLNELEEGELTKEAEYIRLWEKDSLIRMRTVEQLTSSKLTLQSIAKLLGKINNIVINDHVGEAIFSSLDYIYKSTDSLKEGKLLQAFLYSKKAFISSEMAFTDPSLLALLYFPDDQKYAVYIPLFLPIMIPVLISFRQLADWSLKKFKRPV
ncbi:UNVERIFIED_CONTAM: hypothetical protein PYX00_010100 [Menopon gallinae]|uniref:GPI transamidase component PIG-S n=1 Tax=Menopon gallinae TaxID=328185 RepID=A0AAW2HE17_9NEOP